MGSRGQGTSVDVHQPAEIPAQAAQVWWVSVFLSQGCLSGKFKKQSVTRAGSQIF